MEIWICILAGILGTFVMTSFMNLSSLVTGCNFHVPRILGTLVTFETRPSGATSGSALSLSLGYVLHYLIGILFVPFYLRFVLPAGSSTTLSRALLFGLIAGVVAVVFWSLCLRWHPLAPAVNRKLYLPLIFVGHLFFAAGMHYTLLLAEKSYLF